MKHLAGKRASKRKKPVWVLYLLAVVAVVLAVIALVKMVGGLDIFNRPDDSTTPPVIDGTTGSQGSTSTEAPTTTTTSQLEADRAALIEECQLMLKSYYYDDVITLLENAGDLKNDDTEALRLQAQSLKNQLVLYDSDQYYHVFFHSLVIDTDKAFDGDFDSNGYNMYMTTRYEFEKMLPLFLENGFILYDIKEMVQFDANGKASKKPIYLPPGKKPLVISIDDVCYYEYMDDDGFATRLDVDAEGNVVTIVKDASGAEQVTYDGDVMPILDAFVKAHPEFSWQGYKGIVAVTGYQGAFGYRITDLEDYDAETGKKMQQKVAQVADAFRATGWDIACHSYTHNQYWTKGTITQERYDHYEKRWMEEVAPYLGECRIFISPNGAYSALGDDHFAVRRLVESGFTIYCPVGAGMATLFKTDFMLQDRLNLDGLTMINYPERIKKHFFDPALVLDPARPPLK